MEKIITKKYKFHKNLVEVTNKNVPHWQRKSLKNEKKL